MKQLFAQIIMCACLYSPFVSSATLWHRVAGKDVPAAMQGIQPRSYLVYTADGNALKLQLLPLGDDANSGRIIELPMPDGAMRSFKVWHSGMIPGRLAARYPELSTFTGEAVDDGNVTAKLDFTVYGFHAMICDGKDVSFIDPVDNAGAGYYMVHYKRDETREWKNESGEWERRAMQKCEVVPGEPVTTEPVINITDKDAAKTSNGHLLRTYRLAISCNHQYAQAATGLSNPAIAQVLSKVVTTLNRINGVYERELSISMTLAANEDTLIWTAATGTVNGPDPFSAINDNAGSCVNTNQGVCDTRIGAANYDIGHVFTTGAGGLSLIGVACQTGIKAQSVTGQPNPVGDGFDIDYVAHEIGHEYGASHPFNNGHDGSCGGDNINAPTAYEPGSGSTIMAYAGICAPDDIQPHSDAYFHAISLLEIYNYITTGGNGCAVKTPTSGKLVRLPSFTASYALPYLTPFELIAPVATDSVADTSVNYCWEQWNLGDVGARLTDTHVAGPIFRSYNPVRSGTRIFPNNSMVLAGVLNNAGAEDAEGEKAPDAARYLTFKLTVRNIFQGTGCFLIPDDSIHLDVINTGTGFTVTSQNTAGNTFLGGTPQIITWNVAGTNAAPINAANVDIYMSADGGNTWGYHIGSFINNGSATVNLPNPDTIISAARIKVKGGGNVFFNVNSADFTVQHNAVTDTNIQLYPVPAHSKLRVYSGDKGVLQAVIFNAVGQRVWAGEVNGELDIDVSLWARGMYFMKMIDVKKQRTIKKFVVE